MNEQQMAMTLGRRYHHDPRDAQFPMRKLTAELPGDIRTRHWRVGPVLDQGPLPQCVGYAWRQFLSSAPLMTKGGPSAADIYTQAQRVDEWPGEDYDGTSVRAGAKVLRAMGRVSEYLWASSASDVRAHIIHRGPVVLGTNWYDGMFSPDRKGFITPAGDVAGGHAYLVAGYSQPADAFRIINSWGRAWGQSGRAWLRAADLQRLLEEYGEACSALESVPA